MAKRPRKPPSPSDYKDPRAMEYFLGDIHDLLDRVGQRTIDIPNLAAGATTTFTITVSGAVAEQAQQVAYGLPTTGWDDNLIVTARVSAANEVTLSIHNPTGGAINIGSATYSVRVFP